MHQKESNVIAAKECGMNAIQMIEYSKAVEELEMLINSSFYN